MGIVRCLNPNCGKESDYSLGRLNAQDSAVSCQQCKTIHRLKILSSDPGSPLGLRASGLYWHAD
jgi:hypothetical protein